MTEDDFRSNAKYRAALVKVLENEALLQAMAIIKSEYDGIDVPENSSEVASVRRLSARSAVDKAFQAFFRLAKPIPKPLTEQPMDFGTGHDAEDFDALNEPQKR